MIISNLPCIYIPKPVKIGLKGLISISCLLKLFMGDNEQTNPIFFSVLSGNLSLAANLEANEEDLLDKCITLNKHHPALIPGAVLGARWHRCLLRLRWYDWLRVDDVASTTEALKYKFVLYHNETGKKG